jgi:hypothetical protein
MTRLPVLQMEPRDFSSMVVRPPPDIVRRGIGLVQVHARAPGDFLVLADGGVDALAHVDAGCARAQRRFAAQAFDRLREYSRRTRVDQAVCDQADRRIADQPGRGVGAAAFQPDDEVRDPRGLAPQRLSLDTPLFEQCQGSLEQRGRAAFFLDAHDFARRTRREYAFTYAGAGHPLQADHQCRVHVGVAAQSDHGAYG